MRDILLIYSFVCLCSIVWVSSDYNTSFEEWHWSIHHDYTDFSDENAVESDDNENDNWDDSKAGWDARDDNGDDDGDGLEAKNVLLKAEVPKSACWMTLNAAEHFKTMDGIDDQYAEVRNSVQKSLEDKKFDHKMISDFKEERGQAHRELNTHKDRMIPSGINLGGLCMLRMPESVLFFHRMKLRNNTYFHVEYLHNNLTNMMVRINLWLNDLHLMGAFERSLTADRNPSELVYAPTFGQVEFLLKNVKYKMEGRYKVVKDRLRIELVSSEIFCGDIFMTYINEAIESSKVRIEKKNLGSFLSKLKIDLDLWLKDYFNDYLILDADMEGIDVSQLFEYDKKKGAALDEFADKSIKTINNRIRSLRARTVRIPAFTFKSIHTTRIKLIDGVLHGLDSMYRRSVTTGYKHGKIRKLDCVVGFTSLKIVYKYETLLPTALPPLTGELILLANEVTAHLALAMVSAPETVDLDIEFLDQMKPESLTVEGAANLMISNYRHLLEHQIISLMSNNLIHGVTMLKSLPACEPFIPGQIPKEKAKKENLNRLEKKSIMVETDAGVANSASREYWWQKRQPNKSQESIMKQLRSGNLKKNQTSQKKLKSKKSYKKMRAM